MKVDQGFARLPGAGYEAIHPELKGVDPEDYPDINKLAILADVAPYSREYNTYRQMVGAQVKGNTEQEIEYGKILNRVKQTRESIIRMNDRHFTAPVDEISGPVESASAGGITLNEYPGRRFQFSSVGTGAADMSAAALGENNQMTRALRPAAHKNLARPRRQSRRPTKPPQPTYQPTYQLPPSLQLGSRWPRFPISGQPENISGTCRFRPRIAVGVFVMGRRGDPGIFDRVLMLSATFPAFEAPNSPP